MNNEQKFIQPEEVKEQNVPVPTNEINDLEVAKKRIHQLILKQETILNEKGALKRRCEELENKMYFAQTFMVRQNIAKPFDTYWRNDYGSINWRKAWEEEYAEKYEEQVKEHQSSYPMEADEALLRLLAAFEEYNDENDDRSGIHLLNDLVRSKINDIGKDRLGDYLPEINAILSLNTLIGKVDRELRSINEWKEESHRGSIFFKPKDSK